MKDIIRKLYHFLSPNFQSLAMEYKVDFKPRYGHGQPPHQELYNLINQHREAYRNHLQAFLDNKTAIHTINKCSEETDSKQPCWNNGFLPGLDIVAIYSFLKQFQPKNYLEIGSGNSTKVAYKSIQENSLSTKITSIDPMPRVEMDQLADEVIRQPLENIQFDFAGKLESGDILFIDNSHRLLPNSDVLVFFLEILPRLKPGVIVHIHDIYLPYDYPQFMCDRFYSEQYMLAAFLLANPEKYRPILPNFFISEDEELKSTIAPMWDHPKLEGVERHGGSFWLQVG